jgi:FAD/FMN-containing dehydrogenase
VDPFEVARLAERAAAAVLWDGAQVWVRLEGHGVDVDAQARALAALGRWDDVDGGGPALPPHRWSLRPSELRSLDPAAVGSFVASIGVGLVHASVPQRRPGPEPALVALAQRIKHEFDPTGRLNPGRDVWSTGRTGAR